METEVNPFLLDLHMNSNEIRLPPHQDTLCIIKYKEGPFQAAEEHHQVQGEPPESRTKKEGAKQQQYWKSQATPCPRATQRVGVVAPRVHGCVPCTRDPCAHGPN